MAEIAARLSCSAETVKGAAGLPNEELHVCAETLPALAARNASGLFSHPAGLGGFLQMHRAGLRCRATAAGLSTGIDEHRKDFGVVDLRRAGALRANEREGSAASLFRLPQMQPCLNALGNQFFDRALLPGSLCH